MPDEDKNLGGSLVLDLRFWWGHMDTLCLGSFELSVTPRVSESSSFKFNFSSTFN